MEEPTTPPPGKKYWQFRQKHGRNAKYTPPKLWKSAVEYFKWVEENPLKEEKVFHFQGEVTCCEVEKMRAMTIIGLCLHLGITEDTFSNYHKKKPNKDPDKDYFGVTTRIKNIIYAQKFEGACADLLNHNIIARDLGLKDKVEMDLKNLPKPPKTLKVKIINAAS